MTERQDQAGKGGQQGPASLSLMLPPEELLKARCRPSQFARMMGVSKQAVSTWIKEGKVTLGADGLLDPVAASRQVIERSDPARVRARALKDVTAELTGLRRRVEQLEAELRTTKAEAAAREEAAAVRKSDELWTKLGELQEDITERFTHAAAAHREGRLADWLEERVAVIFNGMSVEEFREMFQEDEADAACPAVPGKSRD